MKNYYLPLLAAGAAVAADNTTNATKPWKLRNARRKNMTHWQGLKVALLYRGMHYGTYKSERHGGKFVRVNANHPTVIENHLTKIRRPLERAGATISTVLACTHQSDVVQAWLKNVEAAHSEVIPTDLRKDKKNKVRPNELLQRAYALAATQAWDVLISLRADLFLKRDLADLTRPPVIDKLWLPFREVFLNIHHTPCAFHERPPTDRCLHAWTKHGSRFSDALRIIPCAAVSLFRRGDGVERCAASLRLTRHATQAAHAPRYQSCRR
jgi:PII-like signaling protein